MQFVLPKSVTGCFQTCDSYHLFHDEFQDILKRLMRQEMNQARGVRRISEGQVLTPMITHKL